MWLELLSGHIHQYITFEENDRIYRDLLKPNRIKPFTKYPEFNPNVEVLYKILVKTDIKFYSEGSEINMDDEINFDLVVLQINFNCEYVCCYADIKWYVHKFSNKGNIEEEYISFIKGFMDQDHNVLGQVPMEMKTYDLCKYAVQENFRTLEYVPNEMENI